jgi:hypothetical protein
MHQEVATFGGADQATDRGLLLIEVLLSLRQLHDVVSRVFQRDELAAAWQRDGLVEWPFPAGCFTRCDARAPG